MKRFLVAIVGIVAMVVAGLTFVAPAADAAVGKPAVRAVSPNLGKAGGGYRVTITGANFVKVKAVKFGSVKGTRLKVTSKRRLTVVVPRRSAGGTVDVRIITRKGTSARSAKAKFTYVAPPAVAKVAPAAGPAAGGSLVTLTGTNFRNVTAVKFGTKSGTGIKVASTSKSLTVRAPAGSPGVVHVTVITRYGTSASVSADRYTYVAAPVPAPAVTGLSPSSGPTTGGTQVTITGSAFTGATAVTFGDQPAVVPTVDSATSLTVTTPPGGAGVVDVRVTTPSGTSPIGETSRYTYIAPIPAPAVTGVSPSSGPTTGGTDVTITGTGFTGATSVTFGGEQAEDLTINSATSMTATAPSGDAGVVDVRVTTPSGTSPTGETSRFTYEQPATPAGAYELSLLAGLSRAFADGPADKAQFGGLEGIATDAAGNVYAADYAFDRVVKVSPQGVVSLVAGSGGFGRPRSGPGTGSPLTQPSGLAVDSDGNLFITDTNGVVKVTPSGTLSLIAGYADDYGPVVPGPALSSPLSPRGGLAVDAAGNLYISTWTQIVKVTPAGQLSVIAGNGEDATALPAPDAPAMDTALAPLDLAVDADGTVYVVAAAESGNNSGPVVLKLSDGVLRIVAGTGEYPDGSEAGSLEEGPATQTPLAAQRVAFDGDGNLLISGAPQVAKVDAEGHLSVLAGNGQPGYAVPGAATSSPLGSPSSRSTGGVAVAADGSVLLANDREIVKVDNEHQLSVVAGQRYYDTPRPGPALDSPLRNPGFMTVDSVGSVYFADDESRVVAKVTSDGVLSLVEGLGDEAFSGLAVDGQDNVYVGAFDRILKRTPGGLVSVIAGGGWGSPSNGPALDSALGNIGGLAVDTDGNVYATASGNDGPQVVKISPAGQLTIVAGTGEVGEPHDHGPATDSPFGRLGGIAVDANGDLYLADVDANRVFKVNSDGELSIVVGTGESGNEIADGGLAVDSAVSPSDVAVDTDGNLFVTAGNQVLRVSSDGQITSIAGSGTGLPTPGPAADSGLSAGGIALDDTGNIYVSTGLNGIFGAGNPLVVKLRPVE